MHHDRDAGCLAGLVGRVEHPVVGGDARVHRVDLQRHRAERELPTHLVVDRVVQVRVDVGDDLDAVRVARGDREHVLDDLQAGHLRGVLAHEQRGVDALGRQVGVELRRHHRAFAVVEPSHGGRGGEPLQPRLPGQLERGQPGGVQVDVDERHSVEHDAVLPH